MYEAYFNLKSKPFELVPNPAFLYLSKTHKKAMHYLHYGIQENAGFILLTGEVGSGKTTLVSDLVKRLDKNVAFAKIFNTRVSAEQMIAMINDDLGLEVAGKDKIQLLKDLNNYLIDQHAAKNHTVLIIDEAQNLKSDILEEIRMLSNLETTTGKLLTIVLVGQPELRETLAMNRLRQLRQRVSVSCHLSPLSRIEMEEYILHRLEIAGNRKAVTFEHGCIDAIFEHSRGIPRLANIICDYLLLTAFTEQLKVVDARMVADIVQDLEFDRLYWNSNDRIKKNSTDYSALLNALRITEPE